MASINIYYQDLYISKTLRRNFELLEKDHKVYCEVRKTHYIVYGQEHVLDNLMKSFVVNPNRQ